MCPFLTGDTRGALGATVYNHHSLGTGSGIATIALALVEGRKESRRPVIGRSG